MPKKLAAAGTGAAGLFGRPQRGGPCDLRGHLCPEWKVLGILQTREGAEFVTSIDDATSRPLISSAATAGDSVALPNAEYIVSIPTSEIYLHIDHTKGFGGRIMRAAYWTVRRVKQLA